MVFIRSKAFFENLPMDIIDTVQDHIMLLGAATLPSTLGLKMPELPVDKELCSRLSMVSRRWSRILRPSLFHCLNLARTDEIMFLVEMLLSETSRWLATHIYILRFTSSSSVTFEIPASLSSLLSSLTWLCCEIEYFRPVEDRILTLKTCTSLASLHSLTWLRLYYTWLPSFSAFLKLLSGLHRLEGIELKCIEWQSDTSSKEAPAWLRPPDYLRAVYTIDTDIPWLFPWIFAFACTGHGYSRSSTEPDSNDPLLAVYKDMRIVSDIVSLFLQSAGCSNPDFVLDRDDKAGE